MPLAKSVSRYLDRYAEAEARIVSAWDDSYAHAIAMPACNESPSLRDCFANSELPPLLVVVVINGGNQHPDEVHEQNRTTFEALARSMTNPEHHAWGATGRMGPHRLVLLDRFSSQRRMRPKTGVGLARKIVCDVVLAAWASKKIHSPWIHWADADIVLPTDFFDVAPDSQATAAVYPFEHVPCGDAAVDEAHRLYESYLRYHRLGLAAARSPYAYHAIGSVMAVHAEAYAATRGVSPKRTAGEDFYTLNKLAKLGPILRATSSPVSIRSRRSQRVPFGTGPAVAKIEARTGDYCIYDPRVYDLLALFHDCLDQLAATPDAEPRHIFQQVERKLTGTALAAWRFASEQTRSAEQATRALANGTPQRRQCLRDHFDALRTLKLIHGFRDGGLSDIPIAEALERATFCPVATTTAEDLERLRVHDRRPSPAKDQDRATSI